MVVRKGLGKGLGALITEEQDNEGGIKELRLNEIEPNINQARKHFNDEKLKQLAESIRRHGVVQPIVVKKEDDVYKIVAGERRWRAARLAGLSTIPVIVKDLTEKQLVEISLIENLQREDLNPIEEAEAFNKLILEHDMTQEDISSIVGRSRPAVANSIRLLELDNRVKKMVVEGLISSGHARTLLSLQDGDKQYAAAVEVSSRQLNVRETEGLVKKMLSAKRRPRKKKDDEAYADLATKIQNILKTRVSLQHGNKKGRIVIEYYSAEELERLVQFFVSRETKGFFS